MTAPKMTPEGGMGATPLLGAFAAILAIVEMVVNRMAIHALRDVLDRQTLMELSVWGTLARNVAAVCAVVALTAALLAYLGAPRYGGVHRRLSLAAFGGMFLPTVTLAMVLPPAMLPPDPHRLVLLCAASAHMLVFLIVLIAVLRPGPAGLRGGMALLALTNMVGFIALLVDAAPIIGETGLGRLVSFIFRRLSELGFLVVPIALALAIVPKPVRGRPRVALVLGVGTFAVAATLLVLMWLKLGTDFPLVLYGAQRVVLLVDVAPLFYVLPMGLTIALAAVALARGEPAMHQVGWGVLLLFAAGATPNTPGRLLYTVAAMALLSRASLALGEGLLNSRREENTERVRLSLEKLERSLDEAS